MTDELIAEIESVEGGSRELSDRVLLACGWRRINPGPSECGDFPFWLTPKPESLDIDERKLPDPSRNLQDALDYVVPEGWRICYFSMPDPTLSFKTYNAIQIAPFSKYDEGWIIGPCDGRAATPALALCAAALRARSG